MFELRTERHPDRVEVAYQGRWWAIVGQRICIVAGAVSAILVAPLSGKSWPAWLICGVVLFAAMVFAGLLLRVRGVLVLHPEGMTVMWSNGDHSETPLAEIAHFDAVCSVDEVRFRKDDRPAGLRVHLVAGSKVIEPIEFGNGVGIGATRRAVDLLNAYLDELRED